ncbi:D-Ala-D-Ala carboxypeptidase family metallohydrolase [Alkaliphilus transvaalensis]|uniref:D-Ala-D-Ala carboxypeptidase family metallohydrolase n=1 Tax=Alkaliphilus transvaalensis TaxID=114628 RepID=UPI001A9A4B5F|nr:D-Ala-D-Ala carboxypeptidase family metallohydrolase [Alkaliphilus transvaalensis]
MTRTLRRGDTGEDVRELQIKVAGWASDSPQEVCISIDGSFGPQTEAAVIRFQSSYGLIADGIVGPQSHEQLNWLDGTDGSTRHFAWSEFHCKGNGGFTGGKVGATTVRENVRRLMWKLEALRRKAGNNPVTIVSGFRSINYNNGIGGGANSMHLYGSAADIRVSNRTVTQVYTTASTCGFGGIYIENNATHIDSGIEEGLKYLRFNYPYTVNHIPPSTPYNRRPGLAMIPEYLTIHSTANPSSYAPGERNWLTNSSNTITASWHLVVDQNESIEAIPFNEVAWHAGDGSNGTGNRKSIGLEICESGNRTTTLNNAINMAAKILREYGWGTGRLRTHNNWSGKNCPRILIDSNYRASSHQTWNWFVTEVGKKL